MDLKNIFGDVLFSAAVSTVKELVLEAIKAKIDLRSADLRSADLRFANLRSADLQFANLQFADLQFANLQFANLQFANLQFAKNFEYAAAVTTLLPEGNLVGWKKCRNDIIVKVLVPQKARRSNSTSRKCRAEYVQVLQVFGGEVGISKHDGFTEYRKGQIVKCGQWDENRWEECGGGIHFFITRLEAERY